MFQQSSPRIESLPLRRPVLQLLCVRRIERNRITPSPPMSYFKVVAANKLSTENRVSNIITAIRAIPCGKNCGRRVTAKSYDRFLKDNFFVFPWGLIIPRHHGTETISDCPKPYLSDLSATAWGFFEIASSDNMSSQVGPGNIISTPVDIARWIRSTTFGQRPLTKEQLPE